MQMTGRREIIGIAIALLFGMALAACGGGGGTAGDGGGTATIQGSVPGTLFVAVDNDTNLEAGRVTATGTSGSPKTFSMSVATGKNYRFYVMENEGTSNSRVYPMYIGEHNVFELDNTANGKVISLGMVGPDLTTGRFTPANHPALMMGQGATSMIPPSLAGSAFSMDNVMGTTWGYNTMMTSGTMGWEHGTLSFDNNGLGHMAGIVRNGIPSGGIDNIPYTMSLSGMLLKPGDNTFQCVVSRDGSVMVATFTDSAFGHAMMIAQKRGGTFATSDMAGMWRFQRLTAGGDNTTSGWAYGTMEFVSGVAGITSITTNIGPGTIENFEFSMDPNGIMTETTGATSFHGVMSMDKSMIVATRTNGGNPELWVMMKGTAGTTADMAGGWVMHSVSSGNTGSRDWTYGHSVVDAGGTSTFTGMMGSDGPVDDAEMTFMMNDGLMTMGGSGGGMMGGGMMGGGMMGGGVVPSSFHGIMNGAKNLMVSTYTDGTGGYPFSIQVK
jgi:hypothetical protein